MVRDTRTSATEVEPATYQYDSSSVHQMLLRRLWGRAAFILNVYIDREQLSGNTPRKQWMRIQELRQAGASVYVCRGQGKVGSYHFKSIVVDRRWLFCGSLNVTSKSLDNEESPAPLSKSRFKYTQRMQVPEMLCLVALMTLSERFFDKGDWAIDLGRKALL